VARSTPSYRTRIPTALYTYTFLSQLTPPSLGKQTAEAMAQAGHALEQAGEALASAPADLQTPEAGPGHKTLATIIEEGEQALKDSRFSDAKTHFADALSFCRDSTESCPNKKDPYLVQRLVLATYKAKEPNELSALNAAMGLLDSAGSKAGPGPPRAGTGLPRRPPAGPPRRAPRTEVGAPDVPARDHGCGVVTGRWAVDTSTVFLPVPIAHGAGARTWSKAPRTAAATLISKASVSPT